MFQSKPAGIHTAQIFSVLLRKRSWRTLQQLNSLSNVNILEIFKVFLLCTAKGQMQRSKAGQGLFMNKKAAQGHCLCLQVSPVTQSPPVFAANEEGRGHWRCSLACLGQRPNLPFQDHILWTDLRPLSAQGMTSPRPECFGSPEAVTAMSHTSRDPWMLSWCGPKTRGGRSCRPSQICTTPISARSLVRFHLRD